MNFPDFCMMWGVGILRRIACTIKHSTCVVIITPSSTVNISGVYNDLN